MDDAYLQFTDPVDGRLNKDQLKAFLIHMNECAKKVGLKGREQTDAYIDMIWECCKGYNPDIERPSREELNFIFRYCVSNIVDRTSR